MSTVLLVALAAALGLACDAKRDSPAQSFVGAAACASCHPEEAARWRGSHHDLAMQEATPDTVLGDFTAPPLVHFGEIFELRRDADRFVVRTAGADGAVRDHEVAYTFGVEPLQQYLTRLPGGRLQVLGAAWDTRPAARGGQRWLHLHPGETTPPGDVLHWAGPAGSWNAQCAECHSTGLEKGYDPERDAYEPRWAALDVSCEACHGPGATHVRWAEDPSSGGDDVGLAFGRAQPGSWELAPGDPIAHREPPLRARAELDVCAPCHARRAAIAADHPTGAPFLDGYFPALLEEGLYHADGQILDEVYVWGSFLQSRMYAAGVACSDCHDPHGLRIEQPNASCAQCHRSEVFAARSHHGHEPGTAGASCIACHMPSRTYMVVDERRDHSFRVPRPDLTRSLGVPNACAACHAERGSAWAARAVAEWTGADEPPPHHASALHAGRLRAPGAARRLAALADAAETPPIVRATALRLLGEQLDAAARPSVERALSDPEALVRLAAAGAAAALPPPDRAPALRPLLRDPRRAVRIEAARVLAPLPVGLWPGGPPPGLAAALAEYRAAQRVQADRPESHVNLGLLHAQRGELEQARAAYETALRIGSHFVPAYVNLADLHRAAGRDDLGEAVLRRGLTVAPDSADLHHALGLLQVRRQRLDAALESLARAAELAPDDARYAYVYGVALHDAGETERAIDVLGDAARRHPGDRDILLALTALRGEPDR